MNLRGNEIAKPSQRCGLQPRTLGLHHTYASDLLHAPEKLPSHCIFFFFLPRGRTVSLGLMYKKSVPYNKGPRGSFCPPSTLQDRLGLHYCSGGCCGSTSLSPLCPITSYKTSFHGMQTPVLTCPLVRQNKVIFCFCRASI